MPSAMTIPILSLGWHSPEGFGEAGGVKSMVASIKGIRMTFQQMETLMEFSSTIDQRMVGTSEEVIKIAFRKNR